MRFVVLLLDTVRIDESGARRMLTSIVWYFFSDVYPSLHNGYRPLDPPHFWRNLFERAPADTGAAPINNEIAAAAAPEVR